MACEPDEMGISPCSPSRDCRPRQRPCLTRAESAGLVRIGINPPFTPLRINTFWPCDPRATFRATPRSAVLRRTRNGSTGDVFVMEG